jgi:hypothetical protein
LVQHREERVDRVDHCELALRHAQVCEDGERIRAAAVEVLRDHRVDERDVRLGGVQLIPEEEAAQVARARLVLLERLGELLIGRHPLGDDRGPGRTHVVDLLRTRLGERALRAARARLHRREPRSLRRARHRAGRRRDRGAHRRGRTATAPVLRRAAGAVLRLRAAGGRDRAAAHLRREHVRRATRRLLRAASGGPTARLAPHAKPRMTRVTPSRPASSLCPTRHATDIELRLDASRDEVDPHGSAPCPRDR